MNNSLSAVHPELIVEWSDRNLSLTPDSVTFGSNKKRDVKLVRLPIKENEMETGYAQRIKAAFQSVHIFISSDTEGFLNFNIIKTKINR